MKNYREKFIVEESRTEIDLEPPFYDGDERNEVEVPWNQLDYVDDGVPSMELDELIGILQGIKRRGADRVYIATHEDHHGYYFYGVKLEEI